MARRAKIQLEANEDPELDISSLIDVSFLLLIFFIVTSTLLKREQELTLTLPTTPNPSTELNDPLLIEISEDGKISVDQLELEPAVSDGAARPVPVSPWISTVSVPTSATLCSLRFSSRIHCDCPMMSTGSRLAMLPSKFLSF